MLLEVNEDNLTAFAASLVLGTLQAIRRGVLHPDHGIWPLAFPGFVDPLAHSGRVPSALIEVMRTCDELSLMQEVVPERYPAILDDLIAQVEGVLGRIADKAYGLDWPQSPFSGWAKRTRRRCLRPGCCLHRRGRRGARRCGGRSTGRGRSHRCGRRRGG